MPHIPVMVKECLEGFEGKEIKVFYEGTLGAGGHAKAMLEAHPEIERYFACDRDETAIEIAKKVLEPWKDKVVFIHGNFCDLDKHLKENKMESVDGFFLI